MKLLSTAPFALAALLSTACAPAISAPAQQPTHPLAGREIAVPDPQQGQALPGGLPGNLPGLPRFPSISPDGSAVCFSWRGDLWRVPASGGVATRLTAHAMDEDFSVWSPDGKQIAFNSDRSGYREVYRMNADGTGVTQVTGEGRHLFVSGWSADGTLAMTGFLEADVYKSPRPYAVGQAGGAIERLHDAFGRSPVVSPDGRYVAFVRGRAGWDKPFAKNSDNRDLWLFDREDESFRRLTENAGNDGRPRWLDNETLVYLSARPPARVNLYRLNINAGEGQATALTRFAEDDVQSFDVSRDGKTAVLHVWDKLYTLDLEAEGGEPAALSITAPADTDDALLVQGLSGEANDAALSPDGKVMAIAARGELFVRTIGSKNPPQRITTSVALESEPVWSPDGERLYFTSDRDGTLSIYRAAVALTRSDVQASLQPEDVPTLGNDADAPPEDPEAPEEEVEEQAPQPEVPLSNDAPAPGSDAPGSDSSGNDDGAREDASEADASEDGPDPAERWHDALRFTVEPVVAGEHHDSDPSPSPDGQTLAFRRGNGGIMLRDLATGEERVFLKSWDSGTHWSWRADSRMLAVSYEDQNHNADIWVGPVDGSAPLTNISKHPDGDVLPSFSADGKVLSFLSARNGDQYDVYAVYLDKTLESYTDQQFEDYYKNAKKNAKKKDKGDEEDAAPAAQPADDGLDLEDAYLRLRRLTNTDESEWNAQMMPGGGRVSFTRDGDLYVIGWDGGDEKKLADDVAPAHLSADGSHIAGVRNGSAVTVATDGGKTETVRLAGSIEVDRRLLQKQRFAEASRAITMAFYDGTFKGIDWAGATAKYSQLASQTWTADEFDDVANRYLGLLDASHMGIRSPGPSAANRQPTGRLGARYERVDAGYRVTEVEPNTPAAQGPMRLEVGDVLTAIDFVPIAAGDTVASRLAGRVNRETAVTVQRLREGEPEAVELHLLLTPISFGRYDDIRYDNWQLAMKAKVDELSEGRLGYIHIEAMNAPSLAEFERDLYAACEGREGLLIDVRDNGGGWTTDRLLASIMTRRHAYTVPRGADPSKTNSYPNDRLFIPRYNLPINALCNEHSFSNAEIFSHAFKTLGRGTLVGNTTAGGVISTGGTRLLDGTTIRLPFRGWYLTDDKDMENNGAVPDILIPQSPADEATGQDAQLEAAVADLLERLEK